MPTITTLSLVLVIITFVNLAQCDQSELLSVTLLYRHGCRSPRKLYKNDPYKEEASEIWPEGFGQLTNIGKRETFALGEWYREQYKNFLPKKYSPKFLKVMSSNRDRCLMSAACNLAGLFPPQGEEVWNEHLNWQPIPIHTVPETMDGVILGDDRYCKKYERLFNEVKNSKEHVNFIDSKKNFFEYLTNHTGDNVSTISDLIALHDALFVEDYYNLTLPEWSKQVFPHETLPLMTMTYALETNTTELGRLKSGLLVDLITSFFENVLENPQNSQKMLILSGHDSTIARLMNILGVYDYTWAEYASTLVFELRRKGKGEYIRIYFRDSKKLKDIKLPQCSSKCSFESFKNITKPFRINDEEWKKECSSD